ncbi:5'-nucleotidase, lipoprotein e(P4) family [Ureaplasma urealyticum]|uniref:5'-nucleotidase, lipoprotein e(P4) family n=1 Tax=Ureaplasma urealyticum TaxID=2130 RepID=A0AAP9D7N2_UREUR|nr:5'-nucleotidase, lipoprotein e(P4) family [Ureaplasma urealyticum]QDI65115.1 5'-nucleotidase, lipoprotein e(P4) family [Ureaplasma urealyticum]
MKLLKSKKFWAISLSSILVGASVVAAATACTNSSVESRVSTTFAKTQSGIYAIYEITNWSKLDANEKKSLESLKFTASVIDKDGKAEFTASTGILKEDKVYVKLPREPKADDRVVVKPDNANLKIGAVYVTTLNVSSVELNDGSKIDNNTNQKDESKPYNSVESIIYNQRWLANVWNTLSAEKDGMLLTAYNSAKHQFDAMVKQDAFDTNKVKVEKDASGNITKVTVSNPDSGKAIPVVFMDIDETILNNYANQNYQLLNNKAYSPRDWDLFVADKASKRLAGAFEFIKYVWEHGGVVMFNSNREQSSHIEPTVENLVSEGLDRALLPKWVFWMQGIDFASDKPWDNVKKDAKGKRVKSTKEDRMNTMNERTQGYDLSAFGSGNAVVLKTVMRVGDNFDDFNDNASKGKTNAERVALLKEYGKLFGNFDTKNTKGIKYKKDATSGKIVKSDETWSESYVMIGGNSSYGGFESGIAKGYFGLSKEDQVKALREYVKQLYWEPKNQNK